MPFSPSKAMLLAAGLGERLRPLTLTTPKPLIEIAGHPLIEYNLVLLQKCGVREVMINLHHLGEKIRNALGDGKKYGLKLHYSEEKEILGTGGGIKKVESFFGDHPFIVMNGDVLIDLDLRQVWKTHQSNQALATLVLSPLERKDVKRLVYLKPKNEILSISEKAPTQSSSGYVFTGVQILDSAVLKQLPPHPNPLSHSAYSSSVLRDPDKPDLTAPGERVNSAKSCIVQDAYIPLLHKGQKLSGFVCENYFRDLGTAERYEEVKKEFAQKWPYTTLKPEDIPSA